MKYPVRILLGNKHLERKKNVKSENQRQDMV